MQQKKEAGHTEVISIEKRPETWTQGREGVEFPKRITRWFWRNYICKKRDCWRIWRFFGSLFLYDGGSSREPSGFLIPS